MKIAVVGNGPLTRGLAPFNTDWEVWGLSLREFQYQEIYGKKRGFTYLWECHGQMPDSLEYAEFMDKNNVLLPNSKNCRQLSGPEGFKSSLAWMLAEAILKEPDEIFLCGFDACMVSTEEYNDQIPNIKYFIGLAVGRGIKVTAPSQSEIFVIGNYGELQCQ